MRSICEHQLGSRFEVVCEVLTGCRSAEILRWHCPLFFILEAYHLSRAFVLLPANLELVLKAQKMLRRTSNATTLLLDTCFFLHYYSCAMNQCIDLCPDYPDP